MGVGAETVAVHQLTDWMRRQRWYGGKGRSPELRTIGAWSLESDEPAVTIRTLLVMDHGGASPVLYQVPVTIRDHIPSGWDEHLIGKLDEGGYLFDAPHDPAYARALLRLIAGESRARSEGATAQGHASGLNAAHVHARMTSKVLSGEQSNTSIIVDVSEGTVSNPVICKIFRTLHHGENPDVVLQTALTAAGSEHIPASAGHVTGEWDDPGRPEGRAHGHLAFAQEFLPGVEDAWRVALRWALGEIDFSERAQALGEATAEVHETLAQVLPTRQPSLGDTVAIVSTWHRRLAIALAEVPEIAQYRSAIESVYDAAQSVTWPPLQRIHGDLHLGQVLSVPGRGWMLIDFEGEPLRPMHERAQLDVPLRDVAGMLRSFDYVAGAATTSESAVESTGRWVRRAQEAFLAGYAERSRHALDEHFALLDAFQIDKAVYEAVYEKRNRPEWLPIPVQAIARLAFRGLAGSAL